MKKKSFLFILFFLSVLNLFSQNTKNEANDKVNNFIVIIYKSPIDISSFKLADSLLKLDNDTAIISFRPVEGYQLEQNYVRIYKNKNKWKYDGYHQRVDSKILNNFPDSLNALSNIIAGKHILVYPTYGATLSGSFNYLIIIKNKVVESLSSAIPIAEIPNFDKRIITDIHFFEEFDSYIKSQKDY